MNNIFFFLICGFAGHNRILKMGKNIGLAGKNIGLTCISLIQYEELIGAGYRILSFCYLFLLCISGNYDVQKESNCFEIYHI